MNLACVTGNACIDAPPTEVPTVEPDTDAPTEEPTEEPLTDEPTTVGPETAPPVIPTVPRKTLKNFAILEFPLTFLQFQLYYPLCQQQSHHKTLNSTCKIYFCNIRVV